jgi:hypothetical protein
VEKGKQASQDLNSMMAQTIEQARGAMENYLRIFEKNMAAVPWGGTDLNKKVMKSAEQNIMTAFDYAQKITNAKNLQEVAAIQTEFFQSQMKSLTEQAKEIGEAATKTAVNASKIPTD